MALKKPAAIKSHDEIAIVAMAPNFVSYFKEDPYLEKEWDVLAINNAAFWIGNPTFAIAMDSLPHDIEDYPGYVKRLTSLPCPLISSVRYGDNFVGYPIREVVEFLGVKWDFAKFVLCNTANYALAWAMYMGYKKIYCYGFDFKVRKDGEFSYIDRCAMRDLASVERGESGFCYLWGIANEREIIVKVPAPSTIMDTDMITEFYGYYENQPLR